MYSILVSSYLIRSEVVDEWEFGLGRVDDDHLLDSEVVNVETAVA